MPRKLLRIGNRNGGNWHYHDTAGGVVRNK
jgi:hypothetical protein